MMTGEGTDQSSTQEPIIEARHISVAFQMDRGRSTVLNDVNIDVQRGETLGIVGESGSGKSMFASALLDAVVEPGKLTGEITYHPPDRDPVALLDLSASELREFRWEEIAMVFQGAMSAFNPTMSIGGHFKETLKAHDASVDAGLQRARELLSDVHLPAERILTAYPHELSGGQKQRALIALSLILEPEVLVLDEPTAALDLLMQRSILNLLYDLRSKYDLTMVFISHDLPLVSGFADRIAVMYAFEFVEIGDSSRILRDATHPYTRSLLRATPNLESTLDTMRPIEGESPDPVDQLDGCSYHPRCSLADEQCELVDPELRETDREDHSVACFYWDEARESVPISFESDGHHQADGTLEAGEEVLSLEDVGVHFEQTSLVDELIPPSLREVLGKEELKPIRAVDGVSIGVEERDVLAIVGESGCGKTTLGKAAIGLQRPTWGTVSYYGEDIWSIRDGTAESSRTFEEVRRSLQIIHQDPGSALNPYRTVFSTLSRPLERWNPDLSLRDRRRLISRLLRRTGITPADDYMGRYPHQLSGGEKQRIALIRALMIEPDVILADEAVSALDVSLRIEIMDLMLDLQETFDTSYLFISHNLSNARYIAGRSGGRIGVMYLGEIIEVGPAEEIINDPRHPYTQVLRWATPSLDPEVAEEEMHEMPPVREIDIPDPSDPPAGCRFHTRCPEAREVCRTSVPEMVDSGADGHRTACFREFEDHEYWSSPMLVDEERSSSDGQERHVSSAADD